jgi:hypothetical protein
VQTRLGSLVESWLNTLSGFLINVCLGPFVYPMFGANFSFAQNIGIAVFFTFVSVARGYCWRRLFNRRITAQLSRRST